MSSVQRTKIKATGTIVLVDDDKGIRRSLSLYLGKLGYSMREAENGMDALELIDRESPFLVLADLAMPEMGGMEILEYVRVRRPEIDVILMTGHVDARTAIDAIKAGAFDFLRSRSCSTSCASPSTASANARSCSCRRPSPPMPQERERAPCDTCSR